MPSVSLPILTLAVREQRYSCHGCGNCCRDFTVQLRPEDLEKLRKQEWESKLGGPVTIEFRGVTFLRQREDGACVFLMENGLCRVHAEHGFTAKPIACQLFPFHLLPASGGGGRGVEMGLNFACQSVLDNKGAELKSHQAELMRMAGELAELHAPARPPLLTDRLAASASEARSLADAIDRWLRDDEHPLAVRLDGLAWVASSLAAAKLENVRDRRFADLLDVLFGALPDELEHHPIDRPTSRQMKMLRQAVFARTEDPKLWKIARQGRLRTTLSQLARSRRLKSGRGKAPSIGVGWPSDVDLAGVESIAPASGEDAAVIDDLMTRWLRATVLGGRAWGAGYYGWSMTSGLQATLLNAACAGWLARLHAKGRGSQAIDLADVKAAIGRIDRTSGRAKWLGSKAERLRLAFLGMDDGLRRLLRISAMQGNPSGEDR